MRIALVIGALSFGGAERVMVNLANYLSKNNQVLLCTMFEKKTPYYIEPEILVVQGLANEGKIKSLWKLRKTIKTYKADVVLSFLTQINISTILSLLGTKIPVVVSERNDPNFEPAQYYRKILRRLVFPLADGFVFQTEEAKNYFSKRIRKRSTVIPNPVFVDESVSNVSFSERNGDFVAIGRLTNQKNYKFMIEAFSTIIRTNKHIKLRIYGEGELKQELQNEIISNNAQDNVFLMGTSSDIHNAIKNSLGFLLTSIHEGMPNVLLEAMALGLCCISTDCPCGGPREIISNGINGILVPMNDKNALCKAIVDISNNSDFAKKLSTNAIKVRSDYSLNIIGKKWENYLFQVAKV